MGYTGTSIPIPVGQLGLRTDDAMTSLPANALIKANNISVYSGSIEKVQGSLKYNQVALSSAVVSVFDWWPNPSAQRCVAVTSDGKIWKDSGNRTFNGGVAITDLATTVSTDAMMVSGGQEANNNQKKLFIFTGGAAQIQVLENDDLSTTNIAIPSPDWSVANFPTYGIIYQNRLCVFGCSTNRHRVYFSKPDNHEDFTAATTKQSDVFPGEGDGLTTAIVYRGLLFLFKRPFGVYVIDGRDPDDGNWTVIKYSDSFGVNSPNSVLQILSDLVIANSFGSYTSLQATDAFGNFEAGDILANNLIEEYIGTLFNNAGIPFSQCVYYPEKKVSYFTGQKTSTSTERNLMLLMDVARQQLRASIDTKERPNCLGLRRDSDLVQKPFYGDINGFVWLMEQNTYNRDGVPYIGEFQTAYTDFSFASSELGSKNKIFDFLEVNYIATGNNDFYCDVYVDGQFRQTLKFTQFYGNELDSFILDQDTLAGDPSGSRYRQPLKSTTGNRISFRFYNNGFNESFKIERIIVSFRLSAEQLYSYQK